MSSRLALVFVWPCILFAPRLLSGKDEPRTWRDTLQEIRKNVAAQIVRADNYVCVQDLSRFYYVTKSDSVACEQPPHVPDEQATMKDRLRLDVTVSEGNEIYAWHGANQFSSRALTEIVQRGPISSGGFTGYLRNIFILAGVEFTYRPQQRIDGKLMFAFDYRVPLRVSRYQIRAGDHLMIIPFHGSFTASADTLQLHTLTVIADGETIPNNAELCAIKSTVVYKLTHISSADSLIPASFDTIYGSNRSQTVTESQGNYSQCRQYSGESTVRFDGEESSAQDSKVDVQAAALRSGLMLRIALATEVDSDTAYAGMKVEGTLAHPAKIGSGVVLPVGTRVEGLVTRFETHFQPDPGTLIGIEFNHLTAGNKSYFFRAVHPSDLFEQMVQMPGRRRGLAPTTATRPDAQQDQGVIRFPKSKVRLDQKFVSEYEVVAAK